MFVIESKKHDGGLYDYVGPDLGRFTIVFERAYQFDSFNDAQNFLNMMEESENFVVIRRYV